MNKNPDKRAILFLDTGDNCRCPMAHGYLLKLMQGKGVRHVEIRTAGVMTPTGLLPQAEVVQLLLEEGVDIRRHRSHPLSVDLLRWADLVLGMTPFHVQTALRLCPEAKGRVFLIKEYVGFEGKNVQIQDPMGATLEIFKKVFGEIRTCLHKLVDMDIIARPPRPPKPVIAVPVPQIPETTRLPEAGTHTGARLTPPTSAPPVPLKVQEVKVGKKGASAHPKKGSKGRPAPKKAATAGHAKAAKVAKPVKASRPSRPAARKASARPAPKKKPDKPARTAHSKKSAKPGKGTKPAKAGKGAKRVSPAKPVKAVRRPVHAKAAAGAKRVPPAKSAKAVKRAGPAKAAKAGKPSKAASHGAKPAKKAAGARPKAKPAPKTASSSKKGRK